MSDYERKNNNISAEQRITARQLAMRKQSLAQFDQKLQMKPSKLCMNCGYGCEYNAEHPLPQRCKECGDERKNFVSRKAN